jgi:hypothetical protein
LRIHALEALTDRRDVERQIFGCLDARVASAKRVVPALPLGAERQRT